MSDLQNQTFSDLASELDTIYNNYRDDDADTLDSDKDRAPAPIYNFQKQSRPDPRNGSAIDSSSSSSLFDFNKTTSSLQVLDGSSPYLSSGSVILNSQIEDELLDVDDVDSDGMRLSATAALNRSQWNDSGAAVKVVDEGIIRRGVKDFKFGRTLGEGAYSTVVLAKDKHTQINYAVKILNKRHITKEKKVRYVNIEKNALNRLANRMGIISLYFTFQDEESLYFVLSYALRGELLTLLKKYGSLNVECVRHYGAQILDAIKFMHDNGVVHRDIKPENILLDEKFRIQITDFGTARLLEKRSKDEGAPEEYPLDVRAKSFVGTAEYVLPELLDSKYCGKPGDLWAFGCIIYQMIAGKPPFQAPNEYLTFQKITKLQFAFSAGFPTIVRDLIKQILVLQPAKRLKIAGIQKHYFFHTIDFTDFELIWGTKPPEFGPYKMSAKAMMKMPDKVKERPQTPPSRPKKSTSAPGSAAALAVPPLIRGSSLASPRSAPGSATALDSPRTTSGGNSNSSRSAPGSGSAVLVSPRSSASPRTTPQGSKLSDSKLPDTKLTAASVAAFVLKSHDEEKPQVKAPSRTNSSADYIPGTNILRPTIKLRQISRSSIPKKKPAKSKAVPPMSTLDIAWSDYFNHPDERIIRLGPVHAHREPTESFERKNKGMLYNAPLGLTSKLLSFNSMASNYAGRSSSTLLSQVVNGSTSGLRGGVINNEEKIILEVDAILDFYSEPDSPPPVTSTKHRTLLQKFRLSSGANEKDTEPVSKHPLDRPTTCTMLITTHGRAILLTREESTDTYKLLGEIKVNYPFIQFKEVVGSTSKFQKMLPTTGIFAVESTQTTFVFEVEKFEVGLWTEGLAKAKLSQLERERDLYLKDDEVKSTPKLKQELESPIGPPQIAQELTMSSKTTSPRPSQLMMAAKFKYSSTRRKPPPTSPSQTNPNSPKLLGTTGLGGTDASTNGTLHAAMLAVSHGQQTASTNNRRSSFTKGEGLLPLQRIIPVGVSQKNSKLLARSQRNK